METDMIIELSGELAAIFSEKVALWDVLSERVASGTWTVRAANIGGVVLADALTGEQFYANTLAEAVRLAMESEGK